MDSLWLKAAKAIGRMKREVRLPGSGINRLVSARSGGVPVRTQHSRTIARPHDDRMDFLAGIDLILRGIDSPRRRRRPQAFGQKVADKIERLSRGREPSNS